MQTLTILVTYTAKPGMREIFLNEVTASGILEQIYKEDGCIYYEYYRSVKDRDTLLLVEKWESSDHQKRHMQQPHMTLLNHIKERYVSSTEVEQFFANQEK